MSADVTEDRIAGCPATRLTNVFEGADTVGAHNCSAQLSMHCVSLILPLRAQKRELRYRLAGEW